MRIAVCTLILLGILTGQAVAGLGIHFSTWNTKDLDWGTGFGGKWHFKLIPFVGADVRAGYHRFDGGNAYPLEVSGFLDLGILYGGVGAGYYIIDDLDNSGGTYILAGGQVAPFGFGIFGEAQYRFVSTETEGFKTRLDGFVLNAGVLIAW